MELPLAADHLAVIDFSWWNVVVGLLGGLALFLYGIEKMSDGLRAVAGDGLKTLLAKLTANRFAGVLTGTIVTMIVQSSSLTTVLVVGFVSAGLMTLQQSVGVILGANIGTTLTAQIAAFNVADSAWLLVALGFLAFAAGRRDFARQLGSVLIGLGLLFLALAQMSSATSPLRGYPPFLELMQRLEHPVLGILMGAAFTALVQSSSATTGVLLALSSQGVMTLPAALAIVLGANLGSCVTALLAGLGKPAAARRAAVLHLLFNVLGVALWIFLLPQLALIVESLPGDLPRQVANAHTVFNVSNTLVLIWFTGPLTRLAQRLVPPDPPAPGAVPPVEPRYLDEKLFTTPSLALDRVRLELGHAGEVVLEMFARSDEAVLTGTRGSLERVAEMDRDVNHLYAAIVEFTRKLARREMTHTETASLEDCLAVVNYLENAGDIVASNMVTQGLRRLEHQLTISAPTRETLQNLHRAVEGDLRDALTAFQQLDAPLAERVVANKVPFERSTRAALELLRRRLIADEPSRTRTFQMEVDLVAQLQRLHYLARRIAKVVALPSPEEAEPERTV